MKHVSRTIQTMLLFCCTSVGANAYAGKVAVSKTMPKAFQGHWSFVLKKCGRPDNDGKLKITPKKLSFWETTSNVINVVKLDNMVVVTAKYSSEGETGIESYPLQLRNNNQKLVGFLSDGTEIIRYRCKK